MFLMILFSSFLLLLGLIGPLTKKHSDDLSDSDHAAEEGIFHLLTKMLDLHDYGDQNKTSLSL